MQAEKTRRRPFRPGAPTPQETPPPLAMEAARVWKAPGAHPCPPGPSPTRWKSRSAPLPGIPTAPTATTARRRKGTLDGEDA
jgi:hypothetical protein